MTTRRVLTLLGATTALALGGLASACSSGPDGAAVFEEHCASCHVDPLYPRAPPVDLLVGWSSELVLMTLETGLMAEKGRELTGAERRAVSEFISGGR